MGKQPAPEKATRASKVPADYWREAVSTLVRGRLALA